MFVKVDGQNPTIWEVPQEPNGLDYGNRVVTTPPWLIHWSQELDRDFGFLAYRGGEIPPHRLPTDHGVDGESDPYWIVHWAHWFPLNEPSRGVVTTDPMYILNNNGRTIERVH